jgi:DNA-binding beta-propeller fold protein YncE
MAMLFDAANSHLDKSVKLGAYPKDPLWDIVFTPNGKTAFALGYGAPTSAGVLIAINVSAGTAASPLAVGVGASSLAVAPNGNEAYVLDAGSPPGAQAKTSAGSVVPIDVATDKTGPPIAVTAYAQVMAVS